MEVQRLLRTWCSHKTTIDISIACDLRYDFIASFLETEAANDILQHSKQEWLLLNDYN